MRLIRISVLILFTVYFRLVINSQSLCMFGLEVNVGLKAIFSMKLIQELTFSQHNADRLILVVAPFFLNFLFFYLNHNNIKILSSLALLSCCKLINCDWRKKENKICQPKDHFQNRNDVFPIPSPGYGEALLLSICVHFKTGSDNCSILCCKVSLFTGT